MDTQKKIVIFNSLYHPDIVGGAEISTQILAETLLKDYHVTVITVGNHKKGVIKDNVNQVEVYRLPVNSAYFIKDSAEQSFFRKIIWNTQNLFNFRQYNLVKRLLKEIKPSLIHTQNFPGLGLGIWKAAEELSLPIVHTLRDYYLLNPTKSQTYAKFFRCFAKRFSKRVDRVIGISEWILNKYLQEGYFPNAESYVVPNVIGEKSLQGNVIPKETKHSLVLGYFGRLEEEKGVNMLLSTIEEIPDSIVSEVILCGEGSIGDELKSRYKNDKRVRFLGKQTPEDVSNWMNYVDLTVVPSLWEEPFGRVILESYQVKTPVVATDVGGIPDVVVSKNYLFKPNEPERFKNIITDFYYLTPDEREYEGKQCKDHLKHFSVDSLYEAHKTIYRF